MKVKIKSFYKFAYTPGNCCLSKHKKNVLAYKHMACLYSEASKLQKKQKYSSSFIKDSAFTRKTYPGLESVQR